MFSVELNHVVKSYGDRVVVSDISFTVNQREVFGLIGPNGAGKTTTIRMMMDIIKPDSGEVRVLGEKLTEASKNKIGYLPEERGLYRKLSAIDSIVYLASLKGIDRQLAKKKAEGLLKQVDMLPHKDKKIEELSRGMGQIIQFLVTIIHDPQLIILDEPFAGLDPVNTELLKDMIRELRNQGKAVILSTHRMNEVEELCDRIFMINKGRAVLYGKLAEIKSRYQSNSVILEFQGELGEIEGVTQKRRDKQVVELMLTGETMPRQVLERLVSRGIVVNRFEVATPTLNEIFLKVVGRNNE
jgi:ABC-2 type transport system ATP-binding protein